jgi:hypothetical protein
VILNHIFLYRTVSSAILLECLKISFNRHYESIMCFGFLMFCCWFPWKKNYIQSFEVVRGIEELYKDIRFRENCCWLRQHFHSWIRAPRDPWPYYFVSRLWLISATQSCISEWSSPVNCCCSSQHSRSWFRAQSGPMTRCYFPPAYLYVFWNGASS